MNNFDSMKLLLLNMDFEAFTGGMKKQVTMAQPSAIKKNESLKRKRDEAADFAIEPLVYKGQPWNPEKNPEQKTAMLDAFRLLKGKDGKGLSREEILRAFETNEVLQIVRKIFHYLKRHEPVEIVEYQCCAGDCSRYFIDAESNFECEACGPMEWCTTDCKERDRHYDQASNKLSSCCQRSTKPVLKTRPKRSRCVVCCLICPDPPKNKRHEAYKTRNFCKSCGFIPLCDEFRDFEGEKLTCRQFWHDPRVDSIRGGDLHGFPCENFKEDAFVGVFVKKDSYVSPERNFNSRLLAPNSKRVKLDRFPKPMKPSESPVQKKPRKVRPRSKKC